jgi:hypothetical protein
MDSNIIVTKKNKQPFPPTGDSTINSVCNIGHFISPDDLTKLSFPSTCDKTTSAGNICRFSQ